ncbi:MAG: sigma-70 family RNA polymerase sigma factor [Planctomycetes bacterium]|nr:sigma-70 family RNA polymerase sigma factor [Planctomycetota bacterium]MCB9884285.1 sigma-70 family RNA polymerase sigma factor [Planctomycetota bacterium]
MTPPRDLEASLREHGTGLHQLACALVGRAEADDAVQEVWLEALRAPPSREGPLGGWLRTVLTHIAWRTRRGERRRRTREAEVVRRAPASAEDHADVAAREEQLHRLIAAVHALEPAFRDVIWQRYFEGLPPRAIAAATGEPVATVKSRLLRGLAKLRERLGAAGAGEDASDWRAGLTAAFGIGKQLGAAVTATATTAMWWPGVWLMAAGTKVAAAAFCVAAALGMWWWFDNSQAPPPATLEQRADAPSAPVVATNDAAQRVEVATTPVPPSTAAPAAASHELPAAAPGSAEIRGRLLDADTGEPLAGAVVTWNDQSRLDIRPGEPGDATGADGRFAFTTPAGLGSVVVVAQAPGHVRRWASTGGLRVGQIDDLGDAPMRSGRRLAVRIVDADSGLPVGGPMLEFRFDTPRAGRWYESTANVQSAADGSCPLSHEMPFVTCALAIQGGDHELVGPATVEVTRTSPQQPQELVVTVRRRATIRGLVVDGAGRPLAGIGVSTQGMFAPEVGTDADGVFTLVRRRPTKDPAVTLSFPDTGNFLPHDPLPNVAWGTTGLRIELRASVPFPIEVVDDTGAPLERFAITLHRAGTFSTRHQLRQRGQHDGGRLEVEGVLPGATSLRVVPLDIEWSPSEAVALADESPVRVVVARRVPCRVLVVRGEAPVEGAKVETVFERLPLQVQHRTSLNDPRDRAAPVLPMWPELIAAARTGPDGIASVWRDVAIEKRAVRVQVEGEPDILLREPVFPEDGSPLRIEVPGTGVVRGRVLLAGRARDEVTVRLRAGAYEPHLNLQPDGTFESSQLPAGPCRVDLLLRAGFGSVPVDDLARDLTIDPRQPAEVVFDLGAMSTSKVRGRVVTEGAPPAGLVIDFVRVTAEAASMQATASVGDDGRFAVSGLLPGTYLVGFRLPVATSTFLPALQPQQLVLVGGEDLERDLRFARRKLTVRFVHPDGTPARGHRTVARCGGGRWPAMSLFAPVLDETLVIDPAPALPIEFGGWGNAPWSDPVLPSDRSEAEVTIVVPRS